MKHTFKEELDSFLDEYCPRTQITGVLRVTVKDEIIYQRTIGYADREKKIPFSGNSRFTFYSLSKPFCAIGVLLLAEKGVVDLDSHPGKYVPEAAGFDGKITIRQLLLHISGLPDFLQDPVFPGKYQPGTPERAREHLEILSAWPMRFEPGTAGFYANVNYIILALIIENVSGQSYREYMQKEVFKPLGMTTAEVDCVGLEVPDRVQGYKMVDGLPQPVERSLDWMMGGGDIIGSVDDVYCLNRAIKHRLLLKPETWDEVLEPCPINNKGFGCTVTQWHGKLRVTHNGGHRGFRTFHVQLPEDDFDIIFLSNSGWGDGRTDVGEAVHAAYYGADNKQSDKVEMDTGYI